MKEGFVKIALSDNFFRALYERFPLGVIILSIPQATPIGANDEACHLLGYTEQELVGINYESIITTADKEKLQSRLQRLLSKEVTSIDLEIRCIAKNGKVIWVKLYMKVIRDNNNSEEFIMCTLRNISERKQAEQVLRENERRLSLIFNSTTDGLVLFRVEPGDRFICEALNSKYNDSIKALYPDVTTEIVGRDRSDFLTDYGYTPEQIEQNIPFFHQVLKSKIRVSYETGIPTPRGEVYLQIIIDPVLDHMGNCTHLLWNGRDVTDRKKAERELQEKAKQLSLIFNFNSDALLLLRVVDRNTFICQCANTAYLQRANELFRSDSVTIMGKDLKEFLLDIGVSKEIIKSEFNQYHKALTTKQRVQFETEFPTDQGIKYLEITIEPVVINDNCTHILCKLRDITSRKKAEQRLEQSEERSRLALHAINHGLYDIDIESGIVKVTDEYAIMLGYDPADFHETHALWVDRLHPDDKEKTIACLKSYLEGKVDDYATEFRLKTKSGDWIWVLSVGKIAKRDAHGKPLRMLGTHTDITLRKQAEQTIERTNKELKEIIDALDQSSLVSITDKRGNILKVNKRFCEIARYREDELLGQNHRIVSSGYHSKDFWKSFWKTISHGDVWRGEIENKAKDGTTYWVDTVINPIRNERGEITHYLSIRQDITDRKVYERLLLQSNFRLAQIEQFVDLTTDAIQVSDEEGQLVYINKVASERLGIPQDECHEFNVSDFAPFFKTETDWKNHIEILKKVYSLNLEGVNVNQISGISFPVEVTTRYAIIQNRSYIIAISRDISDQKRNEIALMESEARLTEAQRLAKLGYWQVDLMTNAVWWSDEQYEICGTTKSEFPLSKEGIVSLIHPEDRSWFMEAIHKVISTHTDLTATHRIIRPDGEVRVIQGKAHISCNENNQPVKLLGVNQDITDRVLAEKALQESEQTLLRAQQVAKIGSWKLDVKNNILKWSDEVHKMFDTPPDKELTYEDFLSYIHPEDKEYVEVSWNAALKGDQYDIIHRIIVNNKIKWVREQAELTFDVLHNLIYGFGTVQDITDQKMLQEAILVFNQSQLLTGLGSWRLSVKTKDLYWSENIYNLFDLDKDSVKPSIENYLNAIHPDDRTHVHAVTRSAISNKEPFELAYRVKTRNGETKWLLGKGNVLCDQLGDPIEVYGIIRDITEEKRNTHELVQARKQAEDAATIKDEFLSVMSHEIRTPLNSVIGLSNLLLKRSPREDQLEIMRTLKGSADNLLHLVNDILDFNKIRAGKVELELLPFNMASMLHHLYASFKYSASEKGLDFKVHTDTRIPETLVGDVTRLNQIFNNLLSNAIKFTHEGQIKFQVDLKDKKDKRCILLFSIKDTGIGIAPDKMSAIFKPFHQSDRDISRKYGGTGLGLSIVQSLVEILDGQLGVSSTLGRGTTFTVELGFDILNTERKKLPALPVSHRNKIGTPTQRLTVLYVEDVESNRFLIETLFTDSQIHCISVSSGKAALRFTKHKKFDLILMDLQMPNMDGYQATEKIRNQNGGKNIKTPIIAFTAEPFSELLQNKIKQHGFQDVITKPFDIETLFTKMANHTKRKPSKTRLMSFSFYEKAFTYDKKRLKKIKESLIADIKRFETKMKLYGEKKDLRKMRDEIHRIRPILKNLACEELIAELDQYGLYELYTPEIKKLNNKVLRITRKLLTQTSNLKY